MSDEETLAVYAAKAADYAGLVKGEARDKNLDAFIALLPEGGRVLDWGCGAGNWAALMCDSGFAVTATDASPEFAAQAKTSYGLDVRVETFDALADAKIYDGIWANFSLLHARKSAFPGHLRQAHTALKPQGRFCIGLKIGDGEQRDSIGRFYAYYQEDELEQLLDQAGFTVTDRAHGSAKGLDGQDWPWIVMQAHA